MPLLVCLLWIVVGTVASAVWLRSIGLQNLRAGDSITMVASRALLLQAFWPFVVLALLFCFVFGRRKV